MVAGEKGRFSKSVTAKTSLEMVWNALVDPYALSWMVVGCSFTTPVPTVGAASELRCWWRRFGYRQIASGVFEVDVLEPHRRLSYTELGHRALRFEFALDRVPGGCRVDINGVWGDAGSGAAVRKLVRRWANELPKAANAGPISTPALPLALLDGPGYRPHEMVQTIDISAPSDAIWDAAEDLDGTVVNVPGILRQWTADIAGAELWFSIHQIDGSCTICSLSQLLRHGKYHVTTKSAFWEIEHRLEPHDTGGQLIAIRRWARTLPVKRADFAKEVSDWLSMVKTAAEAASEAT